MRPDGIPDTCYLLDDSGRIIGYLAKGHVTAEQLQHGIWWLGDEDVLIGDRPIEHTIRRCIPSNDPDFNYYFEYSKPGRGAFECTIVEV